MKVAKKNVSKKTPGTLLAEKYRQKMNKLSPAERQRLLDQAMQIAYGQPSATARSDRN